MRGIAEVEAIASFYGIPHSALGAGQVVVFEHVSRLPSIACRAVESCTLDA